MKKVLLLSSAAIALFTIIATSCKVSKEDFKKTMLQSCVTAVPETVPKDIALDYCSCSADRLLQKYSVEEIIVMEAGIKKGDEQTKEKMLAEVKPCIEEMTEKIKARQPE
jgi:hypothetical protein